MAGPVSTPGSVLCGSHRAAVTISVPGNIMSFVPAVGAVGSLVQLAMCVVFRDPLTVCNKLDSVG